MTGINAPRNALAIAAILGAVWLAMMTLGGGASAADSALLAFFHRPGLAPVALAITRLGNFYVLVPLTLLAGGALARWKGPRSAILYLLLVLLGRLFVVAQKAVVARVRPDPAGRLDVVTSMAFPSAHAANLMIASLGFALLAAPLRLRVPAVLGALALAILVGLTRLVLAVHWPSDVLGGWAFGAAWTLFALRLGHRTSSPLRH
jgi:undecaprenyl-diphosphatase